MRHSGCQRTIFPAKVIIEMVAKSVFIANDNLYQFESLRGMQRVGKYIESVEQQ